jgi:predicted RNase H-like nuclease (RuvC/YqgF family)
MEKLQQLTQNEEGQAVSEYECTEHLLDEIQRLRESNFQLREGAEELKQRIKRLEEALDLVRPYCSFVHHSKKHQHAYNEPCPVVALIEKAKEAKP